MGRAKLPIKLINAERSRRTTFTKRQRGLKKKMFEFATLCDVDACMVIYGSAPCSSPQTWPEDPAEVRRVIDRFLRAPKEDRDKRQQDSSTLLQAKNKKLRDELEQRRRENAELGSRLLWNRSSLEAMDLNGVLDLQHRLNSKIKQVSDYVNRLKESRFKQQCLAGGSSSEAQPGSTNAYFQCLRGVERPQVERYGTPLQSKAPPLPATTIAPSKSEEVLLHWGSNNNFGAAGSWFSDYDAALITAGPATPACYCMQRPAAFGQATQESSASFMAGGTLSTTIMDDRKMTVKHEQLAHARPFSLPPLPLTQEDLDLLTGFTFTDHSDPIQGLDHFLGYLID